MINLVRIALASEYHKRGLKREEIIEKGIEHFDSFFCSSQISLYNDA